MPDLNLVPAPDVSGSGSGRRWSLRLGLSITISLLVGGAIFLAVAFAVARVENEFVTLVQEQQSVHARIVANLFDSAIRERFEALQGIAAFPDQTIWAHPEAIQRYLDDKPVAGQMFRRDFYVISPDGERIAEFPHRGNIGARYEGTAYIQKVLDTRKPVVMPLVGRFSGEPNLVFAVPVLDKSGQVLAIMCGSEDLAAGGPFYVADRDIENGVAVVSPQDRLIIAHSSSERNFQPLPQPGANHLLDRRIREGYDGLGEAPNWRGQQTFSTAATIPTTKWIVITFTASDSVFSGVRRLKLQAWYGAALLSVLIGLGVWWLVGLLVRPLSAATLQLATVKPDDTIPVLAERGCVEFRLLFRHFNALGAQLRQQHTALQNERDQLEAKVVERTAALADGERFLRHIADSVPGLIAYWDKDLVNQFANSQMFKWFGVTPESIKGRKMSDFIDQEYFGDLQPLLNGVLRGEAQKYGLANTGPDGTVSHFLITLTPDIIDGEVRGFFGMRIDVTELKQSELRIREQAAELDALYNQAPCGYHLLGPDGTIIKINDTLLSWLGYTRDELVGQNIRVILSEWSKKYFAVNFPKLLAGQNVDEIEGAFVAKSGRIVNVIIGATSILDENGNFAFARVAVLDYSHLHNERVTMQRILSAAPIAVRIANIADNRVVQTNRAYCELVQQDRDGARSLNVRDYYVDVAQFDAIIARLADGQSVVNERVDLRRPGQGDEQIVKALGSYMAIDYLGRPSVLAWLYDVTALDNARAAAEAANRDKETILSSEPVGYLIVQDRIVRWASDSGAQMLGYQRSEIIGRNSRFVYGSDAAYDEMGRVMRDGLAAEGHFRRQVQWKSKLGTLHWIDVSGRPLPSDPSSILITFIDIDTIKRVEAELQDARRKAEDATLAKSAFLANMSHEIRTPMNAIIGLTHLLSTDNPTSEQRDRLGKIEMSSRHLLALIDDILDLSKIEAGKMVIEQKDFQLGALLDQVRSMLIEKANERNLAFEIDQGDVPACLLGDLTRIRQGLVNLVSNAIKFTERGKVVIHVRRLAQHGDAFFVRFEVEDTGIGIAPDKLAHLFSDFMQVDPSSSRNFGGTGLGLAITRRLARLMGGEAGGESTPGQGSRFWFTALVSEGQAGLVQSQNVASVTATALREAHAGAHILLCEDNEINIEVALRLLMQAGMTVDVARDGQQAVEKAGTTDYDLILMDMQMPNMNGVDACRAIRGLLHHRGTPILALTANAFAEHRAECEQAGMNDFMTKPFHPDALYAALQRWLPPRAQAPATLPSDDGTPNPLTALADYLGDDLTKGLAVVGGDQQTYLELVHLFVLIGKKNGQAMLEALDRRDFAKAKFVAHTMKGSAGTLVLSGVYGQLIELDQLLTNGVTDVTQLRAHVEQITDTVNLLSAIVGEA